MSVNLKNLVRMGQLVLTLLEVTNAPVLQDILDKTAKKVCIGIYNLTPLKAFAILQ